MANTDAHLYRSVMGDRFSIEIGEYPGDGVLDPRWYPSAYKDKKGNTRNSPADVTITTGPGGPEVQTGGGTSLHDKPKWYSTPDFWIPKGTEYCSDEIHIRKDEDLRTSPYNPKLSGHHYQLEPKYPMPIASFQGALNNMARAAVVRQIELSKGQEEKTS